MTGGRQAVPEAGSAGGKTEGRSDRRGDASPATGQRSTQEALTETTFTAGTKHRNPWLRRRPSIFFPAVAMPDSEPGIDREAGESIQRMKRPMFWRVNSTVRSRPKERPSCSCRSFWEPPASWAGS